MKIAVLDIGGTSIKSGIYCNDEIHNYKETDTEAKKGGYYVIEKVKKILKDYGAFDRIGVSTAGQVNAKEGKIIYANENLPAYTGMNIKDLLEETFGKPAAVENDVNAAAIGEAYKGAGKVQEEPLSQTEKFTKELPFQQENLEDLSLGQIKEMLGKTFLADAMRDMRQRLP